MVRLALYVKSLIMVGILKGPRAWGIPCPAAKQWPANHKNPVYSTVLSGELTGLSTSNTSPWHDSVKQHRNKTETNKRTRGHQQHGPLTKRRENKHGSGKTVATKAPSFSAAPQKVQTRTPSPTKRRRPSFQGSSLGIVPPGPAGAMQSAGKVT